MMAVFAFAMVFTSCEKDGQYMPKKKITKITYYHSHKVGDLIISTTESERWTWGGDLLSYIDYYNSDGDRTGTLLFRYDDDKRLEEAESSTHNVKYDYANNHLEKIEIRSNATGKLHQKMEFGYKGGKLVSLEISSYNEKGDAPLTFNPLRFFLPDQVSEVMMSKAATKGVIHYTITWSGKNIAEIASDGPDRYSAKLFYDDKVNPFKGFLNTNFDIDQTHSANNLVREESYVDGKFVVVEYDHEYNGKYPTKVKYQTESNTLVPGYTLTVDNLAEYQY